MIELMRERITIQKSSTKKDGTGNHTLVWSDHYKCYSYVNNLSGKEYWEAKQVNAETELDFVIRSCSEISALDTEHFRILFRGNIYNITFKIIDESGTIIREFDPKIIVATELLNSSSEARYDKVPIDT